MNGVIVASLFKRDKNNRVRIWECFVEETLDGKAFLVTGSGLDSEDSKMVMHKKEVCPVNEGKKNYKSAIDRAYAMAKSKVKAKMDEGYRKDVDEIDDVPIKPMLAHNYWSNKNKIKWPCLIQPKLDGVRCLVSREGNKICYRSKNNKSFETLHFLDDFFLEILEDGAMIDGEVYVHGWDFSRIVSALKAYNEDTHLLQFYAYDLVMPDADCETRLSLLQEALFNPSMLLSPIKFTFTDLCDNEENMLSFLNKGIELGFEGAMLRNRDAKYESNTRSYNLLKAKFMKVDEFEIVGVEKEVVYGANGEAVDTARNAIVWRCKTEEGKEFTCVPKGTVAERIEEYKTADEKIGLPLSVQYQKLSEDGVPIFPVGISVRDYE